MIFYYLNSEYCSKCLQLHGLSVYINHPDYDKGNLIIAYVTLDDKFYVTAILFTEVS